MVILGVDAVVALMGMIYYGGDAYLVVKDGFGIGAVTGRG